ncbi:Rrf2 family transcriptional regulator [Rossellomorea marisflavi]|uniref:Transcriptional regulator n=2 Tax=Rossellomorea marisflavi TaxID=189381 RepID=A0A161TIT0_9BACI|nr:Rrf2 family transcriptional regulator [Rossellomorea marisflavi]KQU63163.1 transcriptional regulator [Bacillus sp. Leaf406]VXC35978.1 putative transcriptional regulator [Bacillus sp. 349Y]KZE51140.1 transcriptional regulator [Rossellomorea marisflavi]MDW4525297.1 Rrf2 family transcriptional regulator [Rossellomorea marisflavi]TYS54752.1 Rrf2 family transcriptional regulator [Rossellomorea marisflavi]
MINTRLSVAIHIMSLVAMDPKQSSDQIAQSVTTNPVVIRRLSGDLKKAGLLTSQAGVPGFNLTRDPKDITLLDIYKAVNMEKELFSIHDKPNPKCPVGKRIQGTLDETFRSVQTAMENELNEQTLKDIMNHLFQ